MNITRTIAAGSAAAFLLTAVPAFAQNNVVPPPSLKASVGADVSVGGARVSAEVETRMTNGKSRATQELDRRVKALTELNARVQEMARLSADVKANIAASISDEIGKLNTLKVKIQGDTDLATLKADIKSITNSYRVFALVIPQGHIEVAADKIATAASSLSALVGKFQVRIASAQAAGKDVVAVSASLSDMQAKLADANVQASAAASMVANLTPDNGDKAKMQSNEQVLKDARGKIQVALKDVQDARKDAGVIVKALVGLGVSTDVGATVQ